MEFHTLIHRTSEDGVRCGNRKAHGDVHTYHATTAAVKACCIGDGVCSNVLLAGGRSEDGELYVIECGHAQHITKRGHHCDGGCDYVDMETRYNEGWEYAEDEDEAKALARAGVTPVLG